LGHRNASSAPDEAAVTVNLSGLATDKATVKRMTAPGMDSKNSSASLWAGQSFADGSAEGTLDIEKLQSRNGAVAVTVMGSEGVVVSL